MNRAVYPFMRSLNDSDMSPQEKTQVDSTGITTLELKSGQNLGVLPENHPVGGEKVAGSLQTLGQKRVIPLIVMQHDCGAGSALRRTERIF